MARWIMSHQPQEGSCLCARRLRRGSSHHGRLGHHTVGLATDVISQCSLSGNDSFEMLLIAGELEHGPAVFGSAEGGHLHGRTNASRVGLADMVYGPCCREPAIGHSWLPHAPKHPTQEREERISDRLSGSERDEWELPGGKFGGPRMIELE